MVLGYVMQGNSSNDAIFFNGGESDDVLCDACGSCLNYGYSPQIIDIKPSKKYDISYTHELRSIYSERFVLFCKNDLRSQDFFVPIQAGGVTVYYMMPSRILNFDFQRRKVKFGLRCNKCGEYDFVVGAYPTFLKACAPIDYGFFRTDLAFGNQTSKFPLIVVGCEWKEMLSSQRFRGIDFTPITD